MRVYDDVFIGKKDGVMRVSVSDSKSNYIFKCIDRLFFCVETKRAVRVGGKLYICYNL